MIRNKSIKIFLNYWLGPVIFLWLSWSIFHQLRRQPDLPDAWLHIKAAMSGNAAWKGWLVLLLMLANWGIEAAKWQLLVFPLTPVSWMRSLKAVLAGLAFAVNTPNRIGEYGGRVLYMPEGKRLEAVSLTILGSFAQLLVTMIVGTAGLWCMYAGKPGLNLPEGWESYRLWIGVLCWILTTISGLSLLIYLRISWMVRWVHKIPGWLIDHLPVRILLRVLGWSLLRYAVFLFQYILLLQLFDVTDEWLIAGWLVAVQFLVMAVIPSIALAELGIRGRVALTLFGWISTNSLGIITASSCIWLINLVLPAVAGSLLIIRIKIFATRTPIEK
ncbi:lysylphosphatidylglycerol synthase domain-containing protein [Flavihumibacter petaseus]|uniref:Flippase-like domain-containing protein n=1 Tax=Flavihumibacter petaseus NBRC 106054 TaxID=1220578 RepID=A0A0E9N5V0_9BACT|nr:lysylphosphatidylglycerol synthase domain-containing protein [Flavihumibacter petaseus]GAO45066.1 hypothetical protein FPE01S_04_03090 [Flavihumibacter petaseus NBRC 106054]